MKENKKRFNSVKGKIRVTKNNNYTRVEPMDLAFLASLHLLARAKHLYYATQKEIEDNNTYSSFVLVRAFFETCMAIGYLYLKIEKKLKKNEMEGIWELAFRILQGGKHFPKNNYYDESEIAPVNAFNIYDYFDEVDKHIRKLAVKEKSYAPHREMYDTILSEFGHPNFMGLVTASNNGTDDKGKDYQEVDFERKGLPADRKGCENYLDWGGEILFHYWDRLVSIFKKYNLNLPKFDM